MYLNSHSYFSLRYGTLSPEQLVQAAQRLGIKALALTDVNNTSAASEFVQRCKKAGIKPLLGIDFFKNGRRLYTGIARNPEGFCQLNKFLSEHSIDNKPLPEIFPPTLCSRSEFGAGSLPSTVIIYDRLAKPIDQFAEHEYLGIRPEHVHGLFTSEVKKYPHKLLVFSPITFLNKEGYELHKVLRAIDLNTLLTKLNPTDLAKKTEMPHPPKVLKDFYKLYPRLLENTQQLVDSCHVELKTGLQINLQSFTGSKEGDMKLLEKLAMEGFQRRYANGLPPLPPLGRDVVLSPFEGSREGNNQFERNEIPHRQVGAPTIKARLLRELEVIRDMGFGAYFLITWDIVRYAHAAGYHHVGRGSGANSIVAYCLNITEVDPVDLDLYFERFINRYRPSPPDFDIDFSWDERDDVTDYIFKRYGRERTALLATYSTFQFNAAIREVGKVYGLPKEEIDRFGENILRTTNTQDVRYWRHENPRLRLQPSDLVPNSPRETGGEQSAIYVNGKKVGSNDHRNGFRKNGTPLPPAPRQRGAEQF